LKEERTCVTYDRIVYLWHDKKLFEHPVLQPIMLLADQRKIFQKRYCLLLLPIVIGVTRFVQCLVNEQNAATLFWEIVLLGIICWLLIKHVTQVNMMRLKARQLADRQRETHVFYPYSVVSNFAFEGDTAIERYSDGLALIEVFNLGPFIDKASDTVFTFLEYSAEEKEYTLRWTVNGVSYKPLANDPEAIMKEIERRCLE
jgi:hypothetical protein